MFDHPPYSDKMEMTKNVIQYLGICALKKLKPTNSKRENTSYFAVGITLVSKTTIDINGESEFIYKTISK